MADTIFAEGVRAFKKHDNAPEFVMATVVISINELNTWLRGEGGQYLTEYNGQKQLKLQLLNSKTGAPYLSVDTFKPEKKKEEPKQNKKEESTDLPF